MKDGSKKIETKWLYVCGGDVAVSYLERGGVEFLFCKSLVMLWWKCEEMRREMGYL